MTSTRCARIKRAPPQNCSGSGYHPSVFRHVLRFSTILLGAIGPLQFEIVKYRLESEYGAVSRISPSNWGLVRWLEPDANPQSMEIPYMVGLGTDDRGGRVLLFKNDWGLQYFRDKNPDVPLLETPNRS